jgi:two-component system LytT family sensor kinase
LSDELKFVGRYLAIEKIRFGDRLCVEYDVPAECQRAQIPSFLIQPLVENAVRHGVSKRAAAGIIRISARCDGDKLRVSVSDDGPGLVTEPAPGVGLGNTSSRLEQLFGASAQVRLRDAEAGGAVCEVELPFRLTEAASSE